jgi:predicted nucleic acid-binding protein
MDETDSKGLTSRLVVLDAGPLIHLDELGALDLLADFGRCRIPPTVVSEVERHRRGVLGRIGAHSEIAAPPRPIPSPIAALAGTYPLHAGEIEALAIASTHHDSLFLTDDAAARLAAQRLSIPVHGTIGILLRAIRRGQRSSREVEALLRAIPVRSTLHIKRALLLEIIEEVQRLA